MSVWCGCALVHPFRDSIVPTTPMTQTCRLICYSCSGPELGALGEPDMWTQLVWFSVMGTEVEDRSLETQSLAVALR